MPKLQSKINIFFYVFLTFPLWFVWYDQRNNEGKKSESIFTLSTSISGRSSKISYADGRLSCVAHQINLSRCTNGLSKRLPLSFRPFFYPFSLPFLSLLHHSVIPTASAFYEQRFYLAKHSGAQQIWGVNWFGGVTNVLGLYHKKY